MSVELPVAPPSVGFRQWIGAVMRYRAEHPASARILDTLDRLLDRPYRTNALLTGEPGTGKEGLAKALHAAMHDTPDAPFVEVATRGRNHDELAVELFGSGSRAGAIERAANGTLYLDEVAVLPGEIQARLCDVLRGRFTRRDDPILRTSAVSLVAATDHPDLRALVRTGVLRHDLFHRLARIELEVPPLRERPGDVPRAAVWIGNRVLDKHGDTRRLALVGEAEPGDVVLMADAAQLLEAHPWPGNFRELDAVLERALMLYLRGNVLGAAEIRAALARPADST